MEVPGLCAVEIGRSIMKAQQIPGRVREIVKERSGGFCEVCAQAWAVQIHHRRPRALGGSRDPATNQPSNLLHLCLQCHQHIESHRGQALRQGWLVRQAHNPKDVPVFLCSNGRAVFLDDDGGRREATQAELIEAGVLLPYNVETGDVA